MRRATLTLAMLATLAFPTLAMAQAGSNQTSPGQMGNTSNAPRQNAPDATGTTPRTTGQGIGGAVGGNSTQPGGTNNEQTGSQAHDAQKGAGGNEGGR
jgi:hypothetical protein